jgi:hypothetical protein
VLPQRRRECPAKCASVERRVSVIALQGNERDDGPVADAGLEQPLELGKARTDLFSHVFRFSLAVLDVKLLPFPLPQRGGAALAGREQPPGQPMSSPKAYWSKEVVQYSTILPSRRCMTSVSSTLMLRPPRLAVAIVSATPWSSSARTACRYRWNDPSVISRRHARKHPLW